MKKSHHMIGIRFVAGLLAMSLAGTGLLLSLAVPASSVRAQPNDQAELTPKTDTAKTGSPDVVNRSDGDLVAQKGSFSLYFNSQTAFFALTDSKTGAIWRSNPKGSYEDTSMPPEVISQLVVEYTTPTKQQKQLTNYVDGSVSYTKVADGIRVTYDFAKQKLRIPVEYRLNDRGMTASVLLKDLKSDPQKAIVNRIRLLEYFGAASPDETGYFLIPDGCGALIRFGSGKGNLPAYEKEFYDSDLALRTDVEQNTTRTQPITQPVFGMVKGSVGLLAQVTQGAALGTLTAKIPGAKEHFHHIYTAFNYQTAKKLPLKDQSLDSTSDVLFTALTPTAATAYTLQLTLLDQPNPQWTDFAAAYHTVLQKAGVGQYKATTSTDLVADFWGGVRRKKSFLGILYTARQPLTTFDQAGEILTTLQKNNVISVRGLYQNYSTDYFSRNAQVKLQPAGSLGGSRKLSDLQTLCREKDIPLAMAANFAYLPTGGNGLSTFFDVANRLNLSPAMVYNFALHTNLRDQSRKPYYLVKPDQYQKAVETLQKNVQKRQINQLVFSREATALYSDFSKKGAQRVKAQELWQAQLARLAKESTLVLENPNDYLLPYASYLTDLPLGSSQNLLFDEDIPFLQMSLSGLLEYSCASINITDNTQESFLQALAFDSDLKYALIAGSSDLLATTDMTFLYAATYSTLRTQIAERAAILGQVHAATDNSRITGYQAQGGVSITTFSNATRLVVNRTGQPATVEGQTVSPLSYLILSA